MKKLFVLLGLCLGLSLPVFGQGQATLVGQYSPTLYRFHGAPPATPCGLNWFGLDDIAGSIYYCDLTFNWQLYSSIPAGGIVLLHPSGTQTIAGGELTVDGSSLSVTASLATPSTSKLKFNIATGGRGNIEMDVDSANESNIFFDTDGGIVFNPGAASANQLTINHAGTYFIGSGNLSGLCSSTPGAKCSAAFSQAVSLAGNSSGATILYAQPVASGLLGVPAMTGNLAATSDTTAVNTTNMNNPIATLYGANKNGPLIDPVAWGADPTGSADSTTAWNSAIAYAASNSGTIICDGFFKLNRVQLVNTTYIHGVGDINGRGCTVTPVTDAAFVTSTPASFLQGVTIENIKFIGGTNPIDFGIGNDLHVNNVQLFNFTGCGVAVIAGERMSFDHLNASHTGQNGFAVLCTGDPAKSLFGASQSFCTTGCGVARSTISSIQELGSIGGLGFYTQWLMWAYGNGLDDGTATKFVCFFSCTDGVIQFGNISTAQALVNEQISIIDLDHVGRPGTPQAIGVNVAGSMRASSIKSYAPCWNTNYQTVQLYIEATGPGANSIENYLGCTTVDNAATYSLKFGAHSGLNMDVIASSGGLYVPPGSVNEVNELNVIGSAMTPNNVNGWQGVDATDIGWQATIVKSGNSAAATGLYSFERGGGANTFTTDFTSSGALLSLNEPVGYGKILIGNHAPSISSGFGTSPSITGNNGQTTFRLNVGTGGTATNGIIAMNDTATNGWNCAVNDLTAAAAHVAYNTRETASSTTTVTVENQTLSTGAAIAWAASDILTLSCFAY